LKEEDVLKGSIEKDYASYGLAKRVMLYQSLHYKEKYGLNAIHLILTNLYGPEDKNNHLISSLIKRIYDGENPIKLWGSGKAIREFLYIEDAAEAIISAAENYNGDILNISSGEEISIRDLVNLICQLTEFKGEIDWDESKNDDLRLVLDTSKAKKEINLEIKTNLKEGLIKTINHYKKTHGK